MYTSRIVGIGNYKSKPLVFFTLASQSSPYRELRIDKKKDKINVYPKKGYEEHKTNQNPEIDRYACIVTAKNQSHAWIVGFNGHMAKRTSKNIEDGLNPFMALDSTLFEFRGLKNDARIGAVAYCPLKKDSKNQDSYWLGINDTERKEKRIAGYPNERHITLENKLLFVYDKDTRIESSFDLKKEGLSAKELARYIHENIIGQEIYFGLATGVALLEENGFSLGVYNPKFDEKDIAKWKKQIKKNKK